MSKEISRALLVGWYSGPRAMGCLKVKHPMITLTWGNLIMELSAHEDAWMLVAA